MKFRYLFDPLFISCLGLYIFNRVVMEAWFPRSFFTDHLNDLICIPFCVPIMLFILRVAHLRPDDAPPRSHENIIPLILWSAIFEIWLPRMEIFKGLATADHRDIFYYALGALIAAVWWRVYYGTGTDCTTEDAANP